MLLNNQITSNEINKISIRVFEISHQINSSFFIDPDQDRKDIAQDFLFNIFKRIHLGETIPMDDLDKYIYGALKNLAINLQNKKGHDNLRFSALKTLDSVNVITILDTSTENINIQQGSNDPKSIQDFFDNKHPINQELKEFIGNNKIYEILEIENGAVNSLDDFYKRKTLAQIDKNYAKFKERGEIMFFQFIFLNYPFCLGAYDNLKEKYDKIKMELLKTSLDINNKNNDQRDEEDVGESDGSKLKSSLELFENIVFNGQEINKNRTEFNSICGKIYKMLKKL